MRAKLALEERAALNAADWCNVETLDDYEGPTALITDTRNWIRGETNTWRECYRPMLPLTRRSRTQSTPSAMPRVPERAAVDAEGIMY